MDTIDFSSDYHPLGNYIVRFVKHEIKNNDSINTIEIYTQDKMKILDIKLSIQSTIYLYNCLVELCMYYQDFEYQVPLYNVNESTMIIGYFDMRIIDHLAEDCAVIRIIKENTQEQGFGIEMVSTYYDLEKFTFALYFCLLINDLEEFDPVRVI